MSSKELKKQVEGNILTFLRIRPSKKPSGYFAEDELNPGTLNFNLPENLKEDYINNSKLHYNFHFNGILPMVASQEDVFKKVGAAAVQNALDGFNSTIFAYGQTGSGKTFTITGGTERYADRGIIPRAVSMIYNEFRNRPGIDLKAYISYLELYNEKGYDLLDPSKETKALEDLPKVTILEDEQGNFVLKGLSLHAADTEEAALNLLFMGDLNRAVAETPMNLASSRSHCIFSISLETREAGSDRVRRSKLHLVDLAGSERVSKTNSSGTILSEATHINSSLFFLEMVIVALYEKATKGRTHVPYRNSLMTSVLRDSLGGNCKTIMIATINPEAAQTEESLSTCRFAQRVSLIKNKAMINEGMDPEQVIRRLKNEVLNLREEISFLKGESGEGDVLTPQEQSELAEKCRGYCDDPDPYSILNLGQMTLTKIKDAFAVFKNLVLEARQAAGGGGGGALMLTNGATGNMSADTADLLKQIKDLKSCLLQRDNEIAILVNMVKKGKMAEDGGGGGMSSSRGMSGSAIDDDDDNGESFVAQAKAMNAGDGLARSQGRPKAQIENRPSREEVIIKKHLFGVPPPESKGVFDDMAACFDYFRSRCELNVSIEENKSILKEKMKEAQTAGEKANQSRNTINYLKTSIEAIRREKALQGLSGGGDGKDEDSESGEAVSEEENTYRRAIEQEKVVYRDNFELLRVLKPEIEHIRKILEKGRTTLQSQFDTWHNNLMARGGQLIPSSSSVATRPPVADRTAPSSQAQSKGQGQGQGQEQAQGQSKAQGQGQGDVRPTRGPSEAKARSSSYSNMSDDIDEDVNEDLMAFYKAKEELLKSRSAG